MGMPFPMGLRRVQQFGQGIVPWAWGVNAVMTTLGSILCVLISMGWGFSVAISAGAAVYLIALAAGLDRPIVRPGETDG